MRLLSLILSLVLLIGLSGSAIVNGQDPSRPKPPTQEKPPAQEKEPAQDQDGAIRISARLVTVPVSATDASGQPVKDLKAEDIVIEEEGRPQQVVSLGEPGKTPVEIAMLFDLSGSTHGQFAFEQQAAIQFIKEVMKPGDAISLFSIGITPKMVRARAAGGQDAIAGLMSMEALKEPTAFFDSVVEAARYVNKTAEPGSRHVLIVISDGEENYSKKNLIGDALQELQKSDALFYSINPSGGGIKLNVISTKGQGFMESMASQTGGKAFNLTKVEDLESVFRQIAEELQAQYLFGYYSADEKNEGGFKRISVRAPKRPELRIRSRQGYYVPKP